MKKIDSSKRKYTLNILKVFSYLLLAFAFIIVGSFNIKVSAKEDSSSDMVTSEPVESEEVSKNAAVEVCSRLLLMETHYEKAKFTLSSDETYVTFTGVVCDSAGKEVSISTTKYCVTTSSSCTPSTIMDGNTIGLPTSGTTFYIAVSAYTSSSSTAVATTNTTVIRSAAAVASIGTTNYATLKAAINAATSGGTTITLKQNVTECISTSSTSYTIIDLGGYTWSCSSGTTFSMTGNGRYDIKNGTISNTSTGTSYRTIYLSNGSINIATSLYITSTIYGIYMTSGTIYMGTSSCNYSSYPSITTSGTAAVYQSGGTFTMYCGRIVGGTYGVYITGSSSEFTTAYGFIYGSTYGANIRSGAYFKLEGVSSTSKPTLLGGTSGAYLYGTSSSTSTSTLYLYEGFVGSRNSYESSITRNDTSYTTFIQNGAYCLANSTTSYNGNIYYGKTIQRNVVVDSTYHATLSSAFSTLNSSTTKTIKLLANVVECITVSSTVKAIIDLNGYIWTCTSSSSPTLYISGNANNTSTITITDNSSSVGTLRSTANYAIKTEFSGTLKIEKGKIKTTSSNSDHDAIYVLTNNATVVIGNSTSTTSNLEIMGNVSSALWISAGDVTINNGTFGSTSGNQGIHVDNSATLKIYKGIVYGKQYGIYAEDGASITVGNKASYSTNLTIVATNTSSSYGVYLSGNSSHTTTMTFNGGFMGTPNSSAYTYSYGAGSYTSVTLASSKIIMTKAYDGTTYYGTALATASITSTYYETMQEAIENLNANASGATNLTIKILKSFESPEVEISNKLGTIDLNGKTWSTTAGQQSIEMLNSNITITDSATTIGRITGTSAHRIYISGGSLTLLKGIIQNSYGSATYGAVYVYTGTFNLGNASSSPSSSQAAVNGLYGSNGVYLASSTSYFYMYGGKVTSNSSSGYAIYDKGTASIYAGLVTGAGKAIYITNGGGYGILSVGNESSTTSSLQIYTTSTSDYAVYLYSGGGYSKLFFNSGFIGSNAGNSYAYGTSGSSKDTVTLAGATMNVTINSITGKTIEAAHIGSTQYSTLASAFSALTTTEKTLTIGRNIAECVTMSSAKKVKIDLNGKTWSCSSSSGVSTLYVASASTITITDSTSSVGSIVSGKYNAITWMSGFSGTLKIYRGKIQATSGTGISISGTPTVTIGDSDSNTSNLQVVGSTYAVNSESTANVTINSGKFEAYRNAIGSSGGTLTIGNTYSNINNLQIYSDTAVNAVYVNGTTYTKKFVFNSGFIGNTTGSSVYNIVDTYTSGCATYTTCEYSGARMSTTIAVGSNTYTGKTIEAAHISTNQYALLQDAFDALNSTTSSTLTVGRNINECVYVDSTILVTIDLNGKEWGCYDDDTLSIIGGSNNKSVISIYHSISGSVTIGKIVGYGDYSAIYANFAGKLVIYSGIIYHDGQGDGCSIQATGVLSNGTPLTEIVIGNYSSALELEKLKIINDDYGAIEISNVKLNINNGIIEGYGAIYASGSSQVSVTKAYIIGRNSFGIRAVGGTKIIAGDDSSTVENLKILSLCTNVNAVCNGVSLNSSSSTTNTSLEFNNGFIGSAAGYTNAIYTETNYNSITTAKYLTRTKEYYDGTKYKGVTISSSPAAHVGTKYYDSIYLALDDNSGSFTVILDDDVGENVQMDFARNATIDLNGHIWNSDGGTLMLNTDGSTIIIIDSSTDKSGAVRCDDDGNAIIINSASTVILRDAKIVLDSDSYATGGVSLISSSADFTLDGGTIIATGTDTNPFNIAAAHHLNIKSGLIKSKSHINIPSGVLLTLGDISDKSKMPTIVNTTGYAITNNGITMFLGGYLYSPNSYSTAIAGSGTINYRTTSDTEMINSIQAYDGTSMRRTTVITYVAKIVSTGQRYTNLYSALRYITSTSETIQIINDVDNEQLNIFAITNSSGNQMTLTIDLNGKKWYADSVALFVQVTSTGSGTITIKDSAGGGIIESGGDQTIHYENTNGVGLVINGGTIISRNGTAIYATPGVFIGSSSSNSTVDNTRIVAGSPSNYAINAPTIKIYGGFVGNAGGRASSYTGTLTAASGTIASTDVVVFGILYFGYTVTSSPAAYIDDNGIKTYYATLNDAFNALNSVNEKTIVLNANVEEDVTLSRTVKAIINLNGKTWSGCLEITGGSSNTSRITITDTSSSVGGINNARQDEYAIGVNFSGTINILKGKYSGDYAAVHIENGTVVIGDTNSTTSNLTFSSNSTDSGAGAIHITNGNLTVNNGLISGFIGIYIGSTATVSINKGIITGMYYGILVDTTDNDKKTITIGDTTSSTYTNLKVLATSSSSSAWAVYFLTRADADGSLKNTTFKWNDGFLGTNYSSSYHTYTFDISQEDITFDVNTSLQMNTTTTYSSKTYYGKVLAVAHIGTTYYTNLSSAYSAMSGTTIVLDRNVNNACINSYVTKSGTIDLNGKTWRCEGRALNIGGGSGTITITDSSNGGTIISTLYTIYVSFSGTLNIDKGTLISTGYNPLVASSGNINIGNTGTSTMSNTRIINTSSTGAAIYFPSSTAVVKFYNGFIGASKPSTTEPWTFEPFDVSKLSSYTGKLVVTYSTYNGTKYAGLTATSDYAVHTKYSAPNVTVYYYTLGDAVEVLSSSTASPATIILDKNIDSSSILATISITKNFTLDLNGKTINCYNLFSISGSSNNKSNITITDSSGSVGSITSSSDTISGSFSGIINIYRGIIKTTQRSSSYGVLWITGGTPTINIGDGDSNVNNLQVINDGGGYGIYSTAAANVNIIGGLVTGKTYAVFTNASNSKVVIGNEYSTYDNPKVIAASSSLSKYGVYAKGTNTTIEFNGGFIGSGAGIDKAYYVDSSISTNKFNAAGIVMNTTFLYSGILYDGITLAAVQNLNDSSYYYSLQMAIDDLEVDTQDYIQLKLVINRLNECVSITRNGLAFELDVNGKLWACPSGTALYVEGDNNITITDNSGEMGTITSKVQSSEPIISIKDNSNFFEVSGVNIVTNSIYGTGAILIDNSNYVKIGDTSVETTISGGSYRLVSTKNTINSLNITNTTITTSNGGTLLYLQGTINSLTIKYSNLNTDSGDAIYFGGGVIAVIENTEITLNRTYSIGIALNGTSSITLSLTNTRINGGYPIYYAGAFVTSTIDINAGTYLYSTNTSTSGYGIYMNTSTSATNYINFNGGFIGSVRGAEYAFNTLQGNASANNHFSYPLLKYLTVAERDGNIGIIVSDSPAAYIAEVAENNKLRYYDTLQLAFDYLPTVANEASSNFTITLNRDIYESVVRSTSIRGNTYLNLNGKTIRGGAGNPTLKTTVGSLIIYDDSGNIGKIVSSTDDAIYMASSTVVQINKGIIETTASSSSYAAIKAAGGSLTIGAGGSGNIYDIQILGKGGSRAITSMNTSISIGGGALIFADYAQAIYATGGSLVVGSSQYYSTTGTLHIISSRVTPIYLNAGATMTFYSGFIGGGIYGHPINTAPWDYCAMYYGDVNNCVDNSSLNATKGLAITSVFYKWVSRSGTSNYESIILDNGKFVDNGNVYIIKNGAVYNSSNVQLTTINSNNKFTLNGAEYTYYSGEYITGYINTSDYAAESTYSNGNTKKYYTLKDALDVLGEYDITVNIKLQKDITECISYSKNKGFVLDLNSHTWNCSKSDATLFTISGTTADITITDSTGNPGSLISKGCVLDVSMTGTLTISKINRIESDSSSFSNAIYSWESGTNIIIDNVSYISSGGMALRFEYIYSVSISNVGTISTSTSDYTIYINNVPNGVTINKATIIGNAYGIDMTYTKLTIDDATISGEYGISAGMSTVTINKGTIIGSKSAIKLGMQAKLQINGTTEYTCGNAIPSVNLLLSTGNNVVLDVGAVTSLNSTKLENVFLGYLESVTNVKYYNTGDDYSSVNIPSGYSTVSYTGTFTTPLSTNGAIFTGIAIIQPPVMGVADGGEETYYTGISSAIDAINSSGTITLLADIAECVVVNSNKNITIDLNGHTWIKGDCGSSSDALLNISGSSTILTIKDSSSAQTGNIGSDADIAIKVTGGATLNVLSGTIYGSNYSISSSNLFTIKIGNEGVSTNDTLNISKINAGSGTITVNNGNVQHISSSYDLIINGGSVDNIDINAGSFTMNSGYVRSLYGSSNVVLIMNNGTIKGVTMQSGMITMNGGTSGGIHMYGGIFTMNGGKLESDTGYILFMDSGTANLNKGTIVTSNYTIRMGSSAVINFGDDESTEYNLQYIKKDSATSRPAIERYSGGNPTLNFNSGFISGTSSNLTSDSSIIVNTYGELVNVTITYDGQSYSGVTPKIARIDNTYYRRLKHAFDDLSSTTTESTTIVLLGDPKECISFDTIKIGTIDLNGKTWSDCPSMGYHASLLEGSSSSKITITDNSSSVGKMTTTEHAITSIGNLKIYRGIISAQTYTIYGCSNVIIGNSTSTPSNLQINGFIDSGSSSKITINNGKISSYIYLDGPSEITILKGELIGSTISPSSATKITIGDENSNYDNLKIIQTNTGANAAIYLSSGTTFTYNNGFIGHVSDRDKAYTLDKEGAIYNINGVIINKDITYNGVTYYGKTLGSAYIGDDVDSADKYYTLQEAIAALDSTTSKTIHLARNVNECIVIDTTKVGTIDLNKKKWTCSGDATLDILGSSNKSNISIIGKGSIVNTSDVDSSDIYAIHANFVGNLNISDGISIGAWNSENVVIDVESGTLTIGKDDSEEIVSINSNDNILNASGPNSKINIYNGQFTTGNIIACNEAVLNIYGGDIPSYIYVKNNAIANIGTIEIERDSLDLLLNVIGARARIIRGNINLYVEDTDEFASSIYLGVFDETIDNDNLLINKMIYESNGKPIRGEILFYDGIIQTYEAPEWLPNIVRNSAQIVTIYGESVIDSSTNMYKTYNNPRAVVVATSRLCETKIYSSLKNAIDSLTGSCKNSTITLLGDIMVDDDLQVNGSYVETIDFNGKYFYLKKNTMIVNDYENDTVRFINTSDDEAILYLNGDINVENGCNLVVDNINVKAYADIVIGSLGTLMVNSGKIYLYEGRSIINYGTMYVGGSYGEYDPNKEISNMPLIYLLEGDRVIENKSDAKLIIYDGEITSANNLGPTIKSNGGLVQIGYDGLSAYGVKALPTIRNLSGAATIADASGNSDIRFYMGYLIMLDDDTDEFVDGGTITGDYTIERYTDGDNKLKVLHHNGPALSVKNDDETSYYNTFNQAYNACKDNCTITLLRDIRISTNVLENGISFTIDLNGYNLYYNYGFVLVGDTNLKIINSTDTISYIKFSETYEDRVFFVLDSENVSLVITGKDISTDSTYQSNIVIIANDISHVFNINGSPSASIVTNDVLIDASNCYEDTAILIYKGTYTMNGGYINSDKVAIAGDGGTININYGTIESHGTYAIKYGNGNINIGGVLDCNSSENKVCYPIIRSTDSADGVISAGNDTSINILSGIIESVDGESPAGKSQVLNLGGYNIQATIGNISNCDCETEVGNMPMIIGSSVGAYSIYLNDSSTTVTMESGGLYTLASNGYDTAYNAPDSSIQSTYGLSNKLVTRNGKQYLVNYIDCSSATRIVVEAYDQYGQKYDEYTTLMDAIDNVKDGAELRLIANINECIVISELYADVTINLNGHTWTCTQEGNSTLELSSGNSSSKSLTISNGTINNINSSIAAVQNISESIGLDMFEITINSELALLEHSASYINIERSIINGNIIFKKCGAFIFKSIINGDVSVLSTHVDIIATTINGTTNIDGGDISAANGSMFYSKNGNAINISNGSAFTIKSYYKSDCVDSYVIIKSDNLYSIYSTGENTIYFDGAFVIYAPSTTNSNLIGSEDDKLVINYDINMPSTNDRVYVDGKVYIRWYTVAAELKTSNISEKTYPSLQEAIDDFFESKEMDGKIKLMASYCNSITIGSLDNNNIGKGSLYIDLNGYTLCDNGSLINYAEITIENGEIKGPLVNYGNLLINGEILMDGYYLNSKYGIYNNGGNVSLLNYGNVITGFEYGIWNENGRVEVWHGRISATNTGIYSVCTLDDCSNTIVQIGYKFDDLILGGSLQISGDKYGVYNEKGTFNFYNGSIMGSTAYNEVTDVRGLVTKETIAASNSSFDVCVIPGTGTSAKKCTSSTIYTINSTYSSTAEWRHFAATRSTYTNKTTNKIVTLYSESIQGMIDYYSEDSKYSNIIEEGKYYSIVLLRNVYEGDITIDGEADYSHGVAFNIVLSTYRIINNDSTKPVIKFNGRLDICSELDSSGNCGTSTTNGIITSDGDGIIVGYSTIQLVSLKMYSVTVNAKGTGIIVNKDLPNNYSYIFESTINGDVTGIHNNDANITICNSTVNSISTDISSNTTISISSNIGNIDNKGEMSIYNSTTGAIQNDGKLTIGNGAVINGGITSTDELTVNGNDKTIVSNENGYGVKATSGTFVYTKGTIKGKPEGNGTKYSYYYTDGSTGVNVTRAGEEYTVLENGLYVTNMLEQVAKIGSTSYNTLLAAVSAAQSGDTIVLEKDITIKSVVFSSGKSITLDLNGHTINHYYTFMSLSNITGTNYAIIVDNDLTIINSNSVSSHIVSYEYNSTAVYVRDGALTIGDSNVSYNMDSIIIETDGGYAVTSEGTSLSLYTGKMIVNSPTTNEYKEVIKVSDSRNFNIRDGYHINISNDGTVYTASLYDSSIIYKDGMVGVVYKEIEENNVKKLQIILTPNTQITSINQKLYIYLAMWDDNTHTSYTYTKIECTDTTESYPQIPGATWDVKIPISKLPYLYNVNYIKELTVEYMNYLDTGELFEMEVTHTDLMIVPMEEKSTDIIDKKPDTSGDVDTSCYKVHTDRDVLAIEICNSSESVDSAIFSDTTIRDTIFTYIFGAEWKNVINLNDNSTITLDDYTCIPGEVGVCTKMVNMTITNVTYKNSPTPNNGNDNMIVNAKVLLYVYSPRLNANTANQSVTTCNYGSECVVSDLEFIDYTGQSVNNVVSYITFNGEIVDSIDTTKVGKYLVTTYAIDRYGYISENIIREYNVIDNIAPVVKVNEDVIYVKKGHSFVGLDGLEIYDNYDTNLKIERITDEVNFNKTGSYKIGYKVTDSSGNYTIVYRTVVVKGTNYIGYIVSACAIILAISLLYIRRKKLFSK